MFLAVSSADLNLANELNSTSLWTRAESIQAYLIYWNKIHLDERIKTQEVNLM